MADLVDVPESWIEGCDVVVPGSAGDDLDIGPVLRTDDSESRSVEGRSVIRIAEEEAVIAVADSDLGDMACDGTVQERASTAPDLALAWLIASGDDAAEACRPGPTRAALGHR